MTITMTMTIAMTMAITLAIEKALSLEAGRLEMRAGNYFFLRLWMTCCRLRVRSRLKETWIQ